MNLISEFSINNSKLPWNMYFKAYAINNCSCFHSRHITLTFTKHLIINVFLKILQTQELQKFLLEFDVDNDGMLDFDEFKIAIKTAQSKIKAEHDNEIDI